MSPAISPAWSVIDLALSLCCERLQAGGEVEKTCLWAHASMPACTMKNERIIVREKLLTTLELSRPKGTSISSTRYLHPP